jgi:formate hydrogenlyase subunit 3/multisubunit Na+/H+ antiporter MnhD subunit
MIAFGIGFWILMAGWLVPAMFRKSETINHAGMVVGLLGNFLALVSGISALMGVAGKQVFEVFWKLPIGKATFSIEPLQGFFLSLIALISGLACVYARGYLRHYDDRPRKLKLHWFLFNLLVGSMMLVVTAANAGLFMIAWEVMSVSSFFLVVFSSEKAEARKAGWLYLVFTHIGAAFLLAMFSILAKESGSMEFSAFRANASSLPPSLSAWIFVLAVAGFGMKAGFFPAHVWLPEAHPAAPSHVSAIMSGVMIKTAIYGIIISLSFIGVIQEWEGWLVLVLGVVSGIWGIVMAISRQNLKGMLAYSSVENMGIIGMALGIGILGKAIGDTSLMFFGFAGTLLHILNHSLFKSLLFFGAGAVQTSSGTLDIDRMGGLLGQMPRTGALIVLGSVAIAGLPPLNGFTGEFLLYSSAVGVSFATPLTGAVFSILVIAGLSIIGALALYAFVKLVGVGFLGEPRSPEAAGATEPSPFLYWPMGVLAFLCVLTGFFPGITLSALVRPLADLNLKALPESLASIRGTFVTIEIVAVAFILLVGVIHLLRERILSGREVEIRETWGCGYDRIDSKMQYTASSFAEPIMTFSKPLSGRRASESIDKSFFPASSSLKTTTKDPLMETISSMYGKLQNLFLRMKVIQHGNVHLYVLYIVVALLAALVWGLAL